MTRITNLTALASADGGDTLPIVDVSATTTKKITKTAFLSDVVNGTLISAQAITPTKVDLSVANDAARTALTGFEGLTVYQEDTDAFYVYDGSAWRRQAQWEELGRHTLGVAGDNLSVASMPTRKYLRVYWATFATGGTIEDRMRFNNDSGTNYAYQELANLATFASIVSSNSIVLEGTISAAERFGVMEIQNVASRRKLFQSKASDDNNASATTSANNKTLYGKWDNTSNAITRIDINNGGTGDFAIGSELIVIGRD